MEYATGDIAMNSEKLEFPCPACGCLLDFQPWNGASPSDEICPCCYIQFGLDDSADKLEQREAIYARWRDSWVKQGMPWKSTSRPPPPGWNAKTQLVGLNRRVKWR